MAASRLLRQAWLMRVNASSTWHHASSGLAAGLPGHSMQAPLLSLQARNLCQSAGYDPFKMWRSPTTAEPRLLMAASAQHARSFAEQAIPDKPSKPEKSAGQKQAMGPVSHMRGGMIKAVFISPNVLMEPYRGPGVRLPLLQSWFTMQGWRFRKERTLSNLKSMYALAKLKRSVKGFGLRSFKQEALQVYEEVCQLLAEGDQSRLRQATTPALFGDMKREIKARQDGGWKTVRWSMLQRPTLKQLDIVQGRIMAQNPKDDKTAWVQLTVKIPSQQTFAAYNARRHLVAGSPDTAVKVIDTWVFERALKKDPSTRWRCAGRLSIPSSARNAVPQTSVLKTQSPVESTNDIVGQPTAVEGKQQGDVQVKPVQSHSKQHMQAAAAVM